jgi:hypothetical protein
MSRNVTAAWGLVLGLGAPALAGWPTAVRAQDAKSDVKTEAKADAKIEETEAEKAERAGRRACAAQMCATLHTGKPAEGNVACNVQKTWRKEVLTKILSKGKVSWPWGDTRCTADLKIDRALLAKIKAEPELEAQFDTYSINCAIDKDASKYDVTLQIRPKVTFKLGKAIKASMNWGKIEAPTLAKTALWPITAADNTFGFLQGLVVEDVNEFISTKCMEVKDEWQGK